MRSTNDTVIYDLFFATNSAKGFEKMKEAMWHADPSGTFSFSAGDDPSQLMLLGPSPGEDLARQLRKAFRGARVTGAQIDTFVTEQTIFLLKHAKQALRLMEAGEFEGRRWIEVEAVKTDGSRRRRKTYPSDAIVHFLEWE